MLVGAGLAGDQRASKANWLVSPGPCHKTDTAPPSAQAVTAGAISKRRVDRRIRDDRAGCPIEAAQYQGCTVRPVPSRSAWLRGQSRRDR
jgi:hypothetical protein